MPKQLTADKRRVVLSASFGTIAATFPMLVLLPLKQAHQISDAPYHMGVGFCLGLAMVCIAHAVLLLAKTKSKNSSAL